MGAFGGVLRIVAIVAVGAATIGTPATALPTRADTVDVLTEALESLRAGDDAGYEAAADELRTDGHWLPSAGWDALERGDDEQLSFIWLLLEAPGDEPLLYAFDQIVMERDVMAASNPGTTDLAFLQLIDADGEVILEVLDHRGVGVSPEARTVLEPLPADLDAAPRPAVYDQVVAMMATRIESLGYPLPPIPGLEELIDSFPPEQFPAPEGGPRPVPTALDPVPAIDPAATGGDAGADTASDIEPPGEVDSSGATAASKRRSVDPVTLALGAMGALGLALAVVAMRRNRHNHQLADIAYTDSLTGLGNRRRLDLDMSGEVRNGTRPTSVLMIDVDHFKQFNDRHGHVAGDDVLRRVAAVIARNVRSRDLTYRYGGEEFSVLLPDTAPDEANEVGERIRHAIERARIELADGTQASVTASLGLSSGPAENLGHLVQRADQALYVAKDHGRNRLASG